MRKINEFALNALNNGDFLAAQENFYRNIKLNPCHETYNNLGFYLISEGLICKNGRYRSAFKLGEKYILKAAELKDSAANISARVTINNYKVYGCSPKEKNQLYTDSYALLSKALNLDYSYITHYNYLYFKSLLYPEDRGILTEIRKLIKNYVTENSILLYFGFLRKYKLKDEGLDCIRNHACCIDEAVKLIFYTAIGLYESGYKLCEKVYNGFVVNKELATAILECCIKTNHLDDKKRYIQNIIRNKELDKSFVDMILHSKQAREQIILKAPSYAAYEIPCCYFGCKQHSVRWM